MTDRPIGAAWEAQAEQWKRWARTPGHDHHFHRYNWPSFLRLLPPPGRATLDLGCGEGRAGDVLRARGHRLTGVDFAPSMVRLARETGAYAEVLHADAAALPLAGETFDLVVAFMSLQDMDDAGAALRESCRVLAPGGKLVLAIVHPFASAHFGRDERDQRPYFDVQSTIDEVERDGIAFTFHQVHRPLHGWFALLRDAGYLIEDLREPRPTAQEAAQDPSLAKTRTKPAFLHIRCLKPEQAATSTV
jgi:ubiquinone/menaquinone biosynthesis C-methylase UbiE